MTDAPVTVTRIADGVYRVEHDDRADIIYVTGSTGERWVFWNGRVFRGDVHATAPARPRAAGPAVAQSLVAPMPARVLKVMVEPGAAVQKGATVVLLEAMKMELPIRAPEDGTVIAVHCREGELVQAGHALVDLV